MAREGWDHEKTEDKPENLRDGGKTVRFMGGENCDKCESSPVEQMHQNPVSMVQSLVPHLPGLDKDTIYVISGPFPNYDPVNGPSQLLMATPISPGATVVAVPLGPPPGSPSQCPPPHRQVPNDHVSAPMGKCVPHTVPTNHCNNANPYSDKLRRNPRAPLPPQAMPPCCQPQHPIHGPAPRLPHMLHWDTHHPVGQTIPLRQPNPPVYYNVPSHTSSGLQSPGSDGSSMSVSDMSEDPEEINQINHMQAVQGNNLCYMQPNMMGFPQLPKHLQGHPQFCNLNQHGPMYPHPHPHPHTHQQNMGQTFNQNYIS